MANTNLVHDLVFKEAMRHYRNNSVFINALSAHYDDTYASRGAKAGAAIRLQTPQEFSVSEGATIDVQNVEEKEVTLTRATWRHIAFKYSSAELTQEQVMGGTFSKTKLAPAMATLAAYLDNFCMDAAYKEIYQAVTLPVTALDIDDVLNAGVELDNGSTPRDGNRFCILDPKGMKGVVTDGKALFNNQPSISQQYNDGIIKVPAMGFNFGMSQNVDSHTTGSYDGNYVCNGAGVEGASTLAVKTGAGTYTAGDIITIANVNQVNALTKQSTGNAQKFVVTAAHAGGAGTLSIAPALISTGQYQNIDALPVADAAITELGTASTPYAQCLAIHRGFGAVGFCDIDVPQGEGVRTVRKVEDGISMAYTTFVKGETMTAYMRFDVLFGYKTVIPRWACRIYRP